MLKPVSNIKLTLAYDGTNYFGWQNSLEETLGQVLKRILHCKISLQAASRTDAGVHANGQIVNFFLENAKISPERLKTALNALLPEDIVVLELSEMSESFHATLDSVKKEYHYYICYDEAQLPQHRLYSWHFPRALDLAAMRDAAKMLIGEHDFSAFCNMRKDMHYEHFIRHVYNIDIDELPDRRLRFKIVGNNFLYKMVRNLVGTIVYIGCGKIALDNLESILKGHDRTRAGMTAPARGLFLHRVYYTS